MVCTMVCHKRCIQKAQANTYCTVHGVRAKPPAWQNLAGNLEATNNETTNTEESESVLSPEDVSDSLPSLSALRVPDEDDLRPGMRDGVGGSRQQPNILRRRVVRKREEEIIKNADVHLNEVFYNYICLLF